MSRPRPRSPRLPVEPLRNLLAERVERSSRAGVAREVGVDVAWVRRLLNGSQAAVNVNTADRFCSALGASLAEVYES